MGEKRKIPITPWGVEESLGAKPSQGPPFGARDESRFAGTGYGARPAAEQADVGASDAGASSDRAMWDQEDDEAAERSEAAAAAGAEEAAAELAAAIAERDTYHDSLLRLKAEFDNYRKRSQRELAEAAVRARADVLAEFLPILDNLDRALNAAEHHEEGKVLEGVRLTQALFSQLLRREGVTEMEPLGDPFDPTLHEAMIAAPSPEEEGTVTAVLERGYLLNDQVLRPAKVAVSAGPAEAPAEVEE